MVPSNLLVNNKSKILKPVILKSYLQIILYNTIKNNELAGKRLLKLMSFKSLFKGIN